MIIFWLFIFRSKVNKYLVYVVIGFFFVLFSLVLEFIKVYEISLVVCVIDVFSLGVLFFVLVLLFIVN